MASHVVSRSRRGIAAIGAVVAAFTAVPASATPVPRNEEWWFSTWDVSNKVWPITTGRGVTVAVLDAGINARLADLSDAVLPGIDLTGKKDDGRIDLDEKDGGHGTAMAALIAGQGPTMVGVAPGVKILPVTTFRPDSGVETTDAQMAGIRWAVRHGAKVISMSTGIANPEGALRCNSVRQSVIDYAIRHDVVLVASAGNDGDTANAPSLPAACPGVLAVGAVDSQGNPWVKTERQPYVAVAAPGVDTGSIGRAGIFGNNNGTSTSAALTAGAVALVRAKFPKMSGREVVQRIIASALDVGPRGVDQQTGFGLLRPYHALTDHVAANSPNPVYARWDQAQRQDMATANRPAVPTARPSTMAKPHDKSGGWSSALFAGATVVVLLLLGCVGAILIRRNRQALR